ncbi:MAG: sulfur carrier protein ThiS [Candidatus Baltobacteraceae bacterium]
MKTTVNGEERALAEGATVASLLRESGLASEVVAIAVNRSVVPRATFEERALAEGDAIEIIRAVAGG